VDTQPFSFYTMQYEVVKLDKRHSWHAQFNYMLEFSKSTWKGTGVLDFDRSRRWMNQTWGWTQDVETRLALLNRKRELRNTAVQDEDINLHWSYSVQYNDYRIYLFSEKELAWFQLAHQNVQS
jgi:hypothetical protein